MTPSAIEIEAPAARLIVRFETTERAADQMAAAARTILEDGGASTEILAGAPEQELWQRHEGLIWKFPGVVLKISVLPTDVAGFFVEIGRASPRIDWSVIGRAALGVLLVRVYGEPVEQSDVVRALRRYAADRGGTLAVLEAPANVRSELDVSDDSDRARVVMRAVKARFDPQRILGAGV
jgi:FAD/FMN-containing dehydrogenase